MTASVGDRYLGTVYLLHFNQPYKHARHYIGWAKDVDARLAEHTTGHGARLLQVAHAAGITWTLARTWRGTRYRERRIKNQGGASRFCPLCGITPRRDRRPLLTASEELAYRFRELNDRFWQCTTEEERAQVQAEYDALTATQPTDNRLSINRLMKPAPTGVTP